MIKTDFPWLDDLGIRKEIFNDIPEGEHPLAWAFKSGFLKETAYSLWASSYYKHPLLKDEFFSLAFDVSLIEKFSKLYTWNETCYPIYFWENTLFIACLEPIEIQSEYKTCFAISSYSSMASAWNRHSNKVGSIIEPNNNEVPINLTMEQMTTPEELKLESKESPIDIHKDFDFDFTQMTSDLNNTPHSVEEKQREPEELNPSHDDGKTTVLSPQLPPIPLENTNLKMTPKPQAESLDTLDFSNLSSFNSEPEHKIKNELNNDNHTQTNSDISFNVQTSATSVSPKSQELNEDSIENLPLPDMSFVKSEFEKDISSENSNTKSSTVVGTDESSMTDSDSWTNEDGISPRLNDDYTPLPFLTKTEQVKTKNSNNKKLMSEQTVTDHARPAHIPSKNLISEDDLNKNTSLTSDNDKKGIIAHIFHHLKRDYKELMWAEIIEEGQYYPKFCYGPWDIKDKAWQIPINISQPNIFKIAHSTSLPFHGEISDNHFNDQYIELWLRNQKPDFATVFPVCYDDYCYGFIVGISKGTEFDELKSLKKIENLVSICKNQFLSLQNKKAS